jgi:hypothetical protein
VFSEFDVSQNHGDLADALPGNTGGDFTPLTDLRVREQEPYSEANRRPNLWVLWFRPIRGHWVLVGHYAAEDDAWEDFLKARDLAVDVLVLTKQQGDPNFNKGMVYGNVPSDG